MYIPDFVFPEIIRKIGRALPAAPPQLALVLTLNQMLKKEILPADMSLLAGKQFEIALLDTGITIRFAATENAFIQNHAVGTPDLRFAANTVDFVRLLLQEEDPDTLFFNRKLQIEGDTELGLIIKNLLDSVDWQKTPLACIIGH